MLRHALAMSLGKLYDTFALYLLLRDKTTYLPRTSSAIRPGALACVLNYIAINNRHAIVKYGSGISTLLFSRTLDSPTHRLISFEYDPEWATTVSRPIKNACLADVCQVIHAPVQPCDEFLDGSHWFDTSTIHKTPSTLKTPFAARIDPRHQPPARSLSYPPAVPGRPPRH